MFAVSHKILPATTTKIQSIKIIGDNSYVPFYYQRDHLGRLLKDKRCREKKPLLT